MRIWALSLRKGGQGWGLDSPTLEMVRVEVQTHGSWGGLSFIPRMERITLGDTSSGPVSERPT